MFLLEVAIQASLDPIRGSFTEQCSHVGTESIAYLALHLLHVGTLLTFLVLQLMVF